jgi:protein phosphatase 1L
MASMVTAQGTREIQQNIYTAHDQRLNASESWTDCLTRIWDLFVDTIKSALRWIGLLSDPSVTARLSRQMQYAMQQMEQEPAKPFQYLAAPGDWGMQEERIGGYSVGIAHAQGRRPTMEDEHLATSFTLAVGGRRYPVQLFGIFDGHGGRDAARFVRDNLRAKLQEALVECNSGRLSEEGIWNALKKTTTQLNEEFKQRCGQTANAQGTTATIAMILDGNLWTANVGDARTVLDNQGTPFQLTEDAKPDDPRYKKGIEKRGGSVVTVDGVARINRVLAVARAIGDNAVRGVNPSPKITKKPLSEIRPGSHLILCCDGVYDVARTKDVVHAVRTHRNTSAGNLARNIIYSSHQAGSTDNLSALVVKL